MSQNGKKTALFLCACGPNLTDGLDFAKLVEWAGEEAFAQVETHELLCSPAGREEFRRRLEQGDVDRVVVAGCTPKMHEKTFRGLAEETGLNFAHVQVANIREQCAWVARDRESGTEKAKSIIRAAVRRVERSESLEAPSMEVLTDLLVVGGGLAGIEAALTASQAGRKVTIVERDSVLGGAVVRTEEVAPSLECAPCLLAPRLSAVRDDPNITVLANAEIVEVLGFFGNFTAKVRTKPRYVAESCIGCEACFPVCPVEVESPGDLGRRTRKAIDIPYPGSVPAAAVIDPERCLGILDGSCDACVPACPFSSIDFTQREEEHETQAGAVVVATGLATAEADRFPELGHGRIAEVYTLQEFERLLSSNGPTAGKVLLRDGTPPGSVAIVHCAGSLREDGLSWCSGTCCLDAVKAGRMVRRQLPEASVTHLHAGLVFPGPEGTRFLAKAKEEGVRFLSCPDLRSVRVERQNGQVRLEADEVDPRLADMVVLATGLCPAPGAAELAKLLDVELTPDGFYRAGQPVLGQTASTLDGIFLAGSALGPCDAAQAVTRARAAVGEAIARLVPGRRIELEAMTAFIDPERCAGCKLCLSSCPYRAISHDEEAGVCRVNEALCRGCGTCAAGCPSGAASSRNFTDEQIHAELKGLIDG